MKILWFSNASFTGLDSSSTGTWLGAMAKRLTASGAVEFGNVTMGKVRVLTPRDCLPLRQWLVPAAPTRNDGLPPWKIVEDVLRAVKSFSPDLIHIWGVEAWWGLLNARGFLRGQVLLEMQGIKGACSRVFAGGLTLSEQRGCRGPKELVLGRSIEKDRRKFASWGTFENEIIRGCRHVATQTPWVEAWVRAANPGCTTYHSERMLRQEFYGAAPWSHTTKEPTLFCSAAHPVPYKGLHDTVRAMALLSRRFPKIRLRIAGAHQKTGLRQDGYVRWLNGLCAEFGVVDRIDWLGALSARQIVKECLSCSVFVMSSHIENCCNAMQEALYLGVPTVSAYAGGVPALAPENEAALYYTPGDEAMCAYQVERLLTDRDLSIRMSSNARAIALVRNNPETVISNQLEIYRQVLAEGKNR